MERWLTTPGAARERNREARIGRARQPQPEIRCRVWGGPVAPRGKPLELSGVESGVSKGN